MYSQTFSVLQGMMGWGYRVIIETRTQLNVPLGQDMQLYMSLDELLTIKNGLASCYVKIRDSNYKQS